MTFTVLGLDHCVGTQAEGYGVEVSTFIFYIGIVLIQVKYVQ
jgi:hypothetical protein